MRRVADDDGGEAGRSEESRSRGTDLVEGRRMQQFGESGDPADAKTEREECRQRGRETRLGGRRQRQGADRVLLYRRELLLGHRQRGEPAKFVEGLQQRWGGDLGLYLDAKPERRTEHMVFQPAVRAVGVALVLAQVLCPP